MTETFLATSFVIDENILADYFLADDRLGACRDVFGLRRIIARKAADGTQLCPDAAWPLPDEWNDKTILEYLRLRLAREVMAETKH